MKPETAPYPMNTLLSNFADFFLAAVLVTIWLAFMAGTLLTFWRSFTASSSRPGESAFPHPLRDDEPVSLL